MHVIDRGPASVRPSTAEKTDQYGLTEGDFQLLNELAFAAAMRGQAAEAEAIAAAIELVAPHHVAPVIARALLALSQNDRDGAITLLRDVGMAKPRRWEEAAVLLTQLLDPEVDADEIEDIRTRISESARSREISSMIDESFQAKSKPSAAGGA